MIDADRAGAIAGERVQSHQQAVGGFLQRVEVEQPAGVPNRPRVVAAGLERGDQAFKGGQVDLPLPLALRDDPVIVALGQKVTPIEADRLFQRRQRGRLGQRSFELRDVQRERGIRTPP